jgi:Domain of unknown function (DUF4160)
MVTLIRGPNWKIAIYGREHGIPHFHIEGPGFRASVAITTLEVIIGDVPAPVLKAVRKWALSRRSELLAKWLELNS